VRPRLAGPNRMRVRGSAWRTLTSVRFAHRDAAPGGESVLWLGVAAVVGGVLGAKIAFWAIHWRVLVAAHDPLMWLSGRTVVGGLVGGVLAVLWTRRKLGIKLPSGNVFAPAIALGVGIGRIGCLCRGCCFGTPTHAGWGIDMGDGVLRYPTQIAEGLFLFALCAYLLWAFRRNPAPGVLFGQFMVAYFLFRFGIEFFRFEPKVWGGMTAAQLASIGIVLVYGVIEPARRRRNARP